MLMVMVFTYEDYDSLFNFETDEGQRGKALPKAEDLARVMLGNITGPIEWHIPDVFATRYGSNYIATARHGDAAVRFLSVEGEWKEGDDK